MLRGAVVYWGLPKRGCRRAAPKKAVSEERGQERLPKKSSRRDFAQLKSRSEGAEVALIASAFTHLRRFLSSEITSRVPTLSRGVPLEIPNECVEVETLRETRDAKFHGLLRAKIAGAPRKAT